MNQNDKSLIKNWRIEIKKGKPPLSRFNELLQELQKRNLLDCIGRSRKEKSRDKIVKEWCSFDHGCYRLNGVDIDTLISIIEYIKEDEMEVRNLDSYEWEVLEKLYQLGCKEKDKVWSLKGIAEKALYEFGSKIEEKKGYLFRDFEEFEKDVFNRCTGEWLKNFLDDLEFKGYITVKKSKSNENFITIYMRIEHKYFKRNWHIEVRECKSFRHSFDKLDPLEMIVHDALTKLGEKKKGKVWSLIELGRKITLTKTVFLEEVLSRLGNTNYASVVKAEFNFTRNNAYGEIIVYRYDGEKSSYWKGNADED